MIAQADDHPDKASEPEKRRTCSYDAQFTAWVPSNSLPNRNPKPSERFNSHYTFRRGARIWTADGRAKSTGGSPGAVMTPIKPEALNPGSLSIREIRTIRLRVPAPSPLLPFENGHGRPSEQYRILRTNSSNIPNSLTLSSSRAPPRVMEEYYCHQCGGCFITEKRAHVLLLDADLRKPAIQTQLGLPEAPRLAEMLKGASGVEDALVRTQEFPNLFRFLWCHCPIHQSSGRLSLEMRALRVAEAVSNRSALDLATFSSAKPHRRRGGV